MQSNSVFLINFQTYVNYHRPAIVHSGDIDAAALVNAVISEWGVARAVPIEFKPADYKEGEGKDRVGLSIFFIHSRL